MYIGDPMVLGEPAAFRFRIPQGRRWECTFQLNDAATGQAFNFTGDTHGAWHGRMDIRTDSGALVAHLDDAVTPDGTPAHAGTIAFDSAGHVTATLKSDFTATMSPTRTYQNPGAGWQDQSVLYADLVLVDPADSEPYVTHTGTGVVAQEVTA